ncbi:MAG TPA: cell division protein FtsA [Clostridiales bacterium]|nr:cell division protein FtsA [Clostridiales bacterium]
MKDTVTAIDIGTTKVAVLLCQGGSNDSLILSGFGQAGYTAVHNGNLKSNKEFRTALEEALRQAGKMAGFKINNCTLGVPGEFCGLVLNPVEITLDQPVTRQDVLGLRKQAADYPLPAPWKVSEVAYGSYLADGMPVNNPLGLSCRTLVLEASAICIDADFVRQMTQILNSLKVNLVNRVPVPLAGSKALLTKEEMQEGALWLDVGGESLDMAIHKDNSPIFLDWLPLGGNIITRDIAASIRVSYEEAEKLKRFCVLGLAIRETPDAYEMNLPIRDGKEIFNVPMELLQRVVEARADEILDLVQKRITDAGLQDSYKSMVLTGGGLALFRGIREFAFGKMKVPVRLGVPDVLGMSGPTFSAIYAIGRAGLADNRSGKGTAWKVVKALLGKIKVII